MTKTTRGGANETPNDQTRGGLSNAENRWEARRTSRFPAVIDTGNSGAGVRCTITDTSSAGAMLEFDATSSSSGYLVDSLPRTFWLHMPFDRTQVSCKVAWRDSNRMGIQFVSPMRTLPPPPKRTVPKPPQKSGSNFGWPFKKAN